MATKTLWTLKELCAFLNVPRATIYRWRQNGEGPPAYLLGRSLRFDPDDVEEWLEERKGATG